MKPDVARRRLARSRPIRINPLLRSIIGTSTSVPNRLRKNTMTKACTSWEANRIITHIDAKAMHERIIQKMPRVVVVTRWS